MGCDQWFRHDWSTDTNFLPAAIPKDPSVGIAWGNNFANAWSPDDSTSDVWNPQSPLNRNPWSPDAPYSDPSPEVGQNWAYSPDGGNVTESGGPLLPGAAPILESPMSGAAIQYPAQMPLAELPQECLFPPPSCPVPWVRPSQRWYFDPASGTCSQFQYSCGEGVNNFHTRSLCSSYCQESTRRPFIPNYPPQTTQLQIPTLTASTLPQYIRSNKNTLVEFYTEWCSACRIFGPKFQTIASTLR